MRTNASIERAAVKSSTTESFILLMLPPCGTGGAAERGGQRRRTLAADSEAEGRTFESPAASVGRRSGAASREGKRRSRGQGFRHAEGVFLECDGAGHESPRVYEPGVSGVRRGG